MGAGDHAAASSTARGFADSAGQEKQGGTREEQGGEMNMGKGAQRAGIWISVSSRA